MCGKGKLSFGLARFRSRQPRTSVPSHLSSGLAQCWQPIMGIERLPRSRCQIAFSPLLLSLRTSWVSSFLVFVSLRNNRGSKATYAAQCRGSSRAYLGTTMRRCLGSLIAKPPIHLGQVRSCLCQPLPLSFPHQCPSLRFLSHLGVASFLDLLV